MQQVARTEEAVMGNIVPNISALKLVALSKNQSVLIIVLRTNACMADVIMVEVG